MNVNELPQYKCHKVVRAGKISTVVTDLDKKLLEFRVVGIKQPFGFPENMYRMRSVKAGDYLVVYEDGYVSYSPADVFEAGYSKLPPLGSSSDSTADNFPEVKELKPVS